MRIILPLLRLIYIPIGLLRILLVFFIGAGYFIIDYMMTADIENANNFMDKHAVAAFTTPKFLQ